MPCQLRVKLKHGLFNYLPFVKIAQFSQNLTLASINYNRITYQFHRCLNTTNPEYYTLIKCQLKHRVSVKAINHVVPQFKGVYYMPTSPLTPDDERSILFDLEFIYGEKYHEYTPALDTDVPQPPVSPTVNALTVDVTLEEQEAYADIVVEDTAARNSMSETVTVKLNQPTPPNPKSKRSKRRANNARRSFKNGLHRGRSVAAGAHSVSTRMPDASRAFLSTYLDPAHLKNYNPMGIPDKNDKSTRVFTSERNYTLPLKWEATDAAWKRSALNSNGSSTITSFTWSNYTGSATLASVWIAQTPDALVDAVVILEHDIGAGQVVYTIKPFPNANLTNTICRETGENQYRLMGKGFTVAHVGSKMYRGGYFTTYRTNGIYFHNDADQNNYSAINIAGAPPYIKETMDKGDGVYAVLPIQSAENLSQWHTVSQGALRLILNYSDNGSQVRPIYGFTSGPSLDLDSKADLQAFGQSLVRYVPTTSLDNIVLRLTTFTAVEVVGSNEDGFYNHVKADYAALNFAAAITEDNSFYYPATYNDFQKVLGNLKRWYHKNHDVIDVATGFIPYADNAVKVLDFLTGYNRTGRKQLTRTN